MITVLLLILGFKVPLIHNYSDKRAKNNMVKRKMMKNLFLSWKKGKDQRAFFRKVL